MTAPKTVSSIAVTLGDPAGVGPEITAMALSCLSPRAPCLFHVYGPADLWRRLTQRRPLPHVVFHDTGGGRALTPGQPTRASAKAALRALEAAVASLKNGRCRALVTAPVSKEMMNRAGVSFIGHTEYLAQAFSPSCQPEMMFVAGRYRVILATRHIPLAAVRRQITVHRLKRLTDTLLNTLTNWFGIKHPRIAFCGLNPHAGEDGRIGREEEDILKPLLKQHAHTASLFGPFAADTLFIPARWRAYDAVVAMYHDQGLIPVKSLFFNKAVNLTLGLPFVRTSPAHGTAYDLAGRLKADCGSMKAALRLALRLAERTREHAPEGEPHIPNRP